MVHVYFAILFVHSAKMHQVTVCNVLMDISKVLARGSAKCYVKVDIMLIIPKELVEYVQVNV